MLKRLSKLRQKTEGMTAWEVAREAITRGRRQFAREIERARYGLETSFVTDGELARALAGETIEDVAARIRERTQPHVTVGLRDLAHTAEAVKQFFPDSVEQTCRQADEILAHRLTIFDQTIEFGPEIDWHIDPSTRARWPLYHFTRVPLQNKQGSDVRRVWEINRLQHLTTLGRAYALTSDEKYAEEFLIQVASWYEQNPPRYGVNWTVAMEAAIRAINLAAALELFSGSRLMSDEAIELMLKIFLSHGRFIHSNLEFSHRAPSNHYLSDLIGLFVIGITLPDFRQSSKWVAFSAPRLLQEMNRQVLDDGVSYENSIAYHRFVLEIYALFFALSYANGIELPGENWERLEAMFDFARHYVKPDGTAPLLGDSDDGRLIKFKARPAVDHSYLMSVGAVLLENELFKQSSRIDEEAIWWFGTEGIEAFDSLSENPEQPGSRAFPDSQIFIQRAMIQEPLYAIIDCGDHGLRGRGSHAHSDALSIEVFAFDRTFLRDPGSFVYSASERWRNLFRSTAYHNTVRVDDSDISRIEKNQLFSLGPNVQPEVYNWESSGERDVLEAAHYGYMTLAEPVIHRRIVTFDKREGFWVIEDIFSGRGAHLLEFFFNFDAGLEVELQDDGRATARGKRSALTIVPASGHQFEAEVTTRWVSLAYGTRERASGIIYKLRAEVPFENVTLLVPFRYGDESKADHIGRRWVTAGSE